MDYAHLRVSDGTGDAPLMNITSNRAVGVTTLAVNTVTGLPPSFIITTGTLLPTGYIDPTSAKNMLAHVTGANVIIESFLPGSTDTGNTAGQVALVKPNSFWANYISQLALVAHNNDGTIKDGIIKNSSLSVATGEIGAPWANYTPNWQNFTVGNGVVTARWKQIGKIVYVTVNVVTGTTSVLNGGTVGVGLPVIARAIGTGGPARIGDFIVTDSGLGLDGIVQIQTNSSQIYASLFLFLQRDGTANVDAFISNTGFNLTTPGIVMGFDSFTITMCYETTN